jgi:nucleoside triphosphate diphosphatase
MKNGAAIMDQKKTLEDLIAVMAALRTPVTGCPWDLEQNFATIAPYTIEEAYEVADAIERADMGDLQEELGDLLLQVVYHAQLAQEAGSFAFADVVDTITRKMIRRHPHVFGDDVARSAGVAKGFWEAIKATEKAERGKPAPAGILDNVPVGMPALTRAVKLQSKAARVGFDWPDIAPVFTKLHEEIDELKAALGQEPVERQAEELGDLLFVAANLARHLGIDPETALRSANAKFSRRFAHIEARLAADGRTPAQSDLAEMDALWNEIRQADKA